MDGQNHQSPEFKTGAARELEVTPLCNAQFYYFNYEPGLPNLSGFQLALSTGFVGNLIDDASPYFIHMWTLLLGPALVIISIVKEPTGLGLHHLEPIKCRDIGW